MTLYYKRKGLSLYEGFIRLCEKHEYYKECYENSKFINKYIMCNFFFRLYLNVKSFLLIFYKYDLKRNFVKFKREIVVKLC